MCPLCVVNAAALAASVTSGAGLTGFVVSKFWKNIEKHQTREKQNETSRNGIEPKSRNED